MGGLFGGGQQAAPAQTVAATPALGPYPDDAAKRMPVVNSPSSIAAARKKRDQITSRSGRESTRLVSDAGTRGYANSFLGSVT
jgi:hypothetical protein